jgi:hypothetical protein
MSYLIHAVAAYNAQYGTNYTAEETVEVLENQYKKNKVAAL